MQIRKKILYIITKSNWGGAQKYVFDLASNLPKDRFEAVVAAGGNGPLMVRFNEAGIRTIIIPWLARDINVTKELLSFWSLFQIIRRERPNIVHLNSTKVGGLGAIAAFLYKLSTLNLKHLNIVFTVHGWGLKEDRPLWQKSIIFSLTWFGSLMQDKIIVISTADYETGRKFIPKRKLHLIFHGLETIKFLSREKARESISKFSGQPLDDRSLVLGTIAEYTKNKGLAEFIDALGEFHRRFPKLYWQAFIIGEGEDREILSQKIKIMGLTNYIQLTGFVPDARLYLSAFDIFILPSRKEGLPYVVMEAMSAGIPVVATRVGGIPDLIKDGQDGMLFQPKQAEDLALVIARLADDENLRHKLGTCAAQKMQVRFKLQNMIDQTISLYEQS